MKPSRPFQIVLVTLGIVAVTVSFAAPPVRAAGTGNGMPLSTRLTPAMIDFFGLAVAMERPSLTALAQCAATPACGASDSVTMRIIDASGAAVATYDGQPTTIIEQVRRHRGVSADSSDQTRLLVRRFVKDADGRVVMNGRDSIVTTGRRIDGLLPDTVVRVHRYSDVRYLVNDPRFVWPLTGLVVLELRQGGSAARPPLHGSAHAAVSFDGTPNARIVTTGAVSHRADLRALRLETTLPER